MDIDSKAKSAQSKKYKSARSALAFVLAWCIIIGLFFLAVKFWPHANPVPANIKSQVNFSILYPRNYSIDSNSWKYQANNKTLSVTVKQADYSVALTEEEVPLAYQNDVGAYNRFIGSLKPSANFNVPLGTVSITNLITAGDYQVVGETGILNAKGTLLLAHPDRTLSDDEWRNLFSSLSID